ncbi:MAG: hypothetical protein AAF171_19450 [Cyanobacteria bacterium P01_A01_bin.116]
MIGGIFETIGKTLGIGKENYFLELDDAAEQSVEKLKTSAKAAVETVKDVAEDVVDQATDAADKASDAAEKAIATGKATAEGVVTDAEKAGKKAATATKKATETTVKKAAEKKPAAEKTSAKKGPAPEKAPAPKAAKKAVAPVRSEEDIIVAAIAAQGKPTDSSGNVVDGATTFATDYLLPLNNSSRRRPGPSLGKFKGMAKEANPRLRG